MESAATKFPMPPPVPVESPPDGRKVGMVVFFVSEAAFFSTLLLAYLVFLGDSGPGPTPAEALTLPLAIANTLCLLTSSFTIHRAEQALYEGNRAGFKAWWLLTIILGALFLLGTAYEWHELIGEHHLTISRNLFGTTYFTLVGFHAAHVTVGLLLLVLMLALVWRGLSAGPNPIGVQLISWYWHFVDGVWVVVFIVVYLIGR